MPGIEDKVGWSSIPHEGVDPVAFYNEHYLGMPRRQLQKQDSALYQRLWKDGLLEHVPLSSRFGGDPLKYCQENYPGMPRGQLRKKNPSLYQTLWKKRLLEHVPLEK